MKKSRKGRRRKKGKDNYAEELKKEIKKNEAKTLE